jgi:hypothetical protein
LIRAPNRCTDASTASGQRVPKVSAHAPIAADIGVTAQSVVRESTRAAARADREPVAVILIRVVVGAVVTTVVEL